MGDNLAEDVAAVGRIGVVDRILEVICATTGMGFSAIARVTETAWVACAVRDQINFGLCPGGELVLDTTICHDIRQSGRLVAIDHVAQDDVFCNHPTPKQYGFQSYLSVPIHLPDGRFFGTLCAIDPRPHRVNTPETIGMFTLFADLIAQHLDAQQRLAASEAALLDERATAKLREQFIAVLGHDLRNPLGAIGNAMQVLKMILPKPDGTGGDGDDAAEMLDLIRRSCGRMAGLIDDVLDFARGRLGGGLQLQRVPEADPVPALRQVVAELCSAHPNRSIALDMPPVAPLNCDGRRLGQMLSNLLANAVTHGDPVAPIEVAGRRTADTFELSVTNRGPTIPPAVRDHLFDPFVRGDARPGQQGLGLGLYIASEIAHAHGGTLGVTSADGLTCFTFRMPVENELASTPASNTRAG